jgi:Domain of unknown function (DUF4340)
VLSCCWGWEHGNGGGGCKPLAVVGVLLMADRTGGRAAWRRWRGLALWAVVLLVLGAYLWLVDLPRERAAQQTSEQADKLLSFDTGDATAVEVTTAGSTISLTKDQAGVWQILSPVHTTADQAAVRSLLMSVNDARRLRMIDENPTEGNRYGFAPAALSLRMTVGGVEHQVEFGDNSPVGSSAYVRVLSVAGSGRAVTGGSSAPVLLVPLGVKTSASKNLFDLRKKELFTLAAADVTAVELRYPDQTPSLIRLERQALQADSSGHPAAWEVVAPIRSAADDETIQKLIKQVSTLRATAMLDAGKAEKLATLKRLKAAITLRTDAQSVAVRFYLPFGEEVAYAVTTPEAPLYQVDRQDVLQFEKSLFELRDKRVVQVKREAVQGLRVARADGGFQLTRRQGEWLYKGQPLSHDADAKVKKFLDALWQAKVEKVAGDSVLAWPKLGLDQGGITITLFSGENSATQPVVVTLGKTEGTLSYLRRGGEVDSYITSTPLSKLLPNLRNIDNDLK